MQITENTFRIITLFLMAILLAFNALLYNFCEKQKVETDTIVKQEQLTAQVTSNQFKYQQDKIDTLAKGLEDSTQQVDQQAKDLQAAQDQMKDQKDALLQEVVKRQQIETSLIDVKAETDAIKQDMKSWQKDYVAVLAQLEKKIDDSQTETKALEDNLVALDIPDLKRNISSIKADVEKMSHPGDNVTSGALPDSEKKIERSEIQSQ